MTTFKIDANAILPTNYGLNSQTEDPTGYIKETLKRNLPNSEKKEIDGELNFKYVLRKHRTVDKKTKQKPKKKHLTRNERSHLNLLKLPRDCWNYKNLLPINKMWQDYMRENLDLIKRAPSYTDVDYGNFNVILSKSEFIGAKITVVRSITPSNVGIGGIVVLETRGTFQVVTKDSKLKILLKHTSVFTICLDDMKFTIFGKHLMTRPGERSVKKIKSFILPDL